MVRIYLIKANVNDGKICVICLKLCAVVNDGKKCVLCSKLCVLSSINMQNCFKSIVLHTDPA